MSDTETEAPLETTHGSAELMTEFEFLLQSPADFRDDFVEAASRAQERVSLLTMQFEVNSDTEPMFEAMKEAEAKGVDTRFVYDRVARKHLRHNEDQAWTLRGRTVFHRGDKLKLRQSNADREGMITAMEESGVTDPVYKQRFKDKAFSHNHIKLAIVDQAAWFGTMNLRGLDFKWSNFMMKVTDTRWVEALKHVFDDSGSRTVTDDMEIFDDAENPKNALLVDGGKKQSSVIYEKACDMVDSLEDGDEIIYIGQWPPVKMAFGKLANKIYENLATKDIKAKFLISPEDQLHPTKWGSRKLQKAMDRKVRKHLNLHVKNLARPTHAKAILINRADGSSEVLFGSHNFTRFTVKNGTKELSMWSQDLEVVDQLSKFLSETEAE